MTPLDALRNAGLIVHDVRVNPRPGRWDPWGVLWHHTGTANPPKSGTPASLRICQRGRSDLPGPLCQWVVGGDGDWWWVTDGRANHAGAGDKDVWSWLQDANVARADNPPRPNDNADTGDGNGHLVGIEVEGNGNWSADVYRSVATGTRALLAHYHCHRDNVIGHKEWTTRKVDPAGIDMAAARAQLRATQPPPQEEDDMAHRYGDKSGVDKSQVLVDGPLAVIIKHPESAAQLDAGNVKTILLDPGDYADIKKQATNP